MKDKTAKKIRVYSKKMAVTAPKPSKSLYDKDFCAWASMQSGFLKNGELDKLDRNHLSEEIESLGNEVERALESYLSNLLMHKLKIVFQPTMHTRSWDLSIRDAHFHALKLIRKNPSLKHGLVDTFTDAYYSARLKAASETGLDLSIFPKDCPWTIDKILDTKQGK